VATGFHSSLKIFLSLFIVYTVHSSDLSRLNTPGCCGSRPSTCLGHCLSPPS